MCCRGGGRCCRSCCCGSLCIYHNRAGHNVIVLAVLRGELPCQGVLSSDQFLELADDLRCTLGAVLADAQPQLFYQITLGVAVTVHGHFHCRVSLCHQEMQGQVCGIAVFRGECKGHVLAVCVHLCRLAGKLTAVQLHAVQHGGTSCNLDGNAAYGICIFHVILQVNFVHVLTVNALDLRGRCGNLNQNRFHRCRQFHRLGSFCIGFISQEILFAVLAGPVFHVSGFGVSRILGIGFHERMTICYLFRCVAESVFCQRRIAGNRNFRQFVTVIKCTLSDACDTLWNGDAG